MPTKTTGRHGVRVLQKISERAREANGRNAAASTGPRTAEGKRIASRNAVTHGLLSETVRIGEFPDELRERFEQVRNAIVERLEPEGEIEYILAERVVSAAWRLRRVGHIEQLLTRREMETIDDFPVQHDVLRTVPAGSELAVVVRQLFARGVYEQLSRYEVRIERGLYKALHELQRLQGRRRGEAVPPPLAVDVEVSGVL